jgi:hypothetical protein
MRVCVREGNRLIRDLGWQDNLILDQGLDKIATVYFANLFAACAVGTGTDPTTIRPPTIATVNANVLTANAPTFSNADLDSDVRFDSGQYFKIQSITSPTQVTLFTSAPSPVGAGPFTILRTNQAGLSNEVKRTINYSQVPAANQTTDLTGDVYLGNDEDSGTLILQRTFLFAPETSNITYTEIGFSDLATAGPNLFSRILLSTPLAVNGPVATFPGQQLQVTYQLSIGFDYGQGPGVFFTGSTPITIAVTGLPISYAIQDYVTSTGAITGKLQVHVIPPMPARIGDIVTVAGSSVAGYNGDWSVLNVALWNAASSPPGAAITLNTPFTTAATAKQGTLSGKMTGKFFRACYGIYIVQANGGTVPPPRATDLFIGAGEPSVAGQGWIAKDLAANLGSNGNPLKAIAFQLAVPQLQPYTHGNFYIDKTVSFTVADNDPINSFGIGEPDNTNQVESWTFDQAKGLGAGSSIQFVFRFSWNRTSF